MKKILIVLFTIMFFLSVTEVKAKPKISIIETSYAGGKITVGGTGIGEMQIVLFGLDNSPLYLTTVTAEYDDTFSITFPEIAGLKEGIYNIKISDYDGTETSSGTVKITAERNPQTSDNIMTYLLIGGICLLVIIIIGTHVYKTKKNSKN